MDFKNIRLGNYNWKKSANYLDMMSQVYGVKVDKIGIDSRKILEFFIN